MKTHFYIYLFTLLHILFVYPLTKHPEKLSATTSISAKKKPSSLRQVWETDTLLRTPESVLYEPSENVLYVSNINGNGAVKDGNGFISKLTLEGQITTLEWATGLNAPKGMGISGNKLFVADIDRLVMFDLGSGAILKSYTIAEPVYLNDITVGESGIVYVSDNRNDKIYYLRNDSLQIFMEGESLQRPNGLYIEGNKLAVGSQKNNALQIIDLDSKKITKITDGLGASDGVEPAGRGAYFFSDWNGRVFWISSKGEKKLLLNTTAAKVNSADIEYISSKKLLFVPTFNGNTVVAYRVR
ncbi:NHL repeat-containing protein [Rhodocytophaga rosea]|uniref:ATP-binding protein n=1 Tax=Rhodocytophaga rosea TaxID=2704465 RepID=UPI001E41A571|nr:ATP-binding protein [Rhodocytophaga rosea]